MKLWDKIVKGVNPDEEEPFNDVFDDDEIYGSDGGFGNNTGDISDFMSNGGYSPYGNTNNQNQGGYSQGQQSQQQSYGTPAPASGGGSLTVTAGSNMQFSAELKVVKPEDCKSEKEIADHLINRRTVILNLEETNKETARRLIDFLRGVAYAIQGQLERVSERTFVIAPNNIVISPEQIKAEQHRDNNTDNSIY
ncbi:MAG: cell division protein SepF [Oscillospiraceae bacterium]|nr:cell division protein SepF [Oscillospiraceae bacterium]